jgi:hypothetical protein
MGDLSDFEGQMISVCLAGASVTITATLLGSLRATVFRVMTAYINHWRATSAKKNSRQIQH